MDSLEIAANAFNAINAGEKPPSSRDESSTPVLAVDDLFGDLGVPEYDDESPVRGGGDDDLPLKGAKAKKPDPEDEYDDIDVVEGDEDEDDEDTGDDSDAEDDEEDEGEADPVLAREFEIIIDGEPAKVTVDEALKGYIRQETFHQRLNEVRDMGETLRTEAGKLYADRKKAIELINDLQGFYDKLIPAEPNWDQEYAKDPVKARALQKQYETVKAIRDGLDTEKKKIGDENKADTEDGFLEYRRGENIKLLKAYPHWQDPAKGADNMKRDLSRMFQTLTETGFTEEEIRTIYDSRMIKVAMKAAKYDRLMAKKIKAVPERNNRPPNSGVGRDVSRNAPKGNRGAREVLRKTGSIEAAANVFTDIIAPKRRK